MGAVFPNRCLGCGAFFVRPTALSEDFRTSRPGSGIAPSRSWQTDVRGALGSHVCEPCLDAFLPVESPICQQCGSMFGSREGDDRLCGDCIRRKRSFRKARALCVYERTGLALVHALKYKGKIQLAAPLGLLLHAAFCRYWDDGEVDTIMPVPLHRSRFRERGFNQAYLLLKDWPDRCLNTRPGPGDAVGIGVTVDRDSLVRARRGESQTGSGREQRMENVRRAFAVTNPDGLDGKTVLLVDDVYTTGATVESCARALLSHGASAVDVLTLARAM